MNYSIIREANVSDCDLLVDLMGQLGYPTTSEEMLDQIKFYKSNQFYKIWVIECEGVVTGSISVVLLEYFHRKARFMRITSLIVGISYRRQGLGKLLVKFAEKFAQKNGCVFIELTSGAHRAKLGSHDFYKLLGYEDVYETKKYLAKKLAVDDKL